MLAEPVWHDRLRERHAVRASRHLEEQLVPRAGGLEVHRRRVAVFPDGGLAADLLGLAVGDFLSVTSARPLKWTLVGRRSAFAPCRWPFHTVMPSTMIFSSSNPDVMLRWHSA
jgi:hypothetical protein